MLFALVGSLLLFLQYFPPMAEAVPAFAGAVTAPQSDGTAGERVQQMQYPQAMAPENLPYTTVPELSHRHRGARATVSLGTRRNLVLLIRWGDHQDRKLPLPSDYAKIFNTVGGDPVLAETGSVYDYWYKNSFQKLRIESVVTPWITVSQTEKQVTATSSTNKQLVSDAVVAALTTLVSSSNVNGDTAGPKRTIADFDTDGDGYVDMFTMIHSGYAAEINGADPSGTPASRRVQSSRTQIYTSTGTYGWSTSYKNAAGVQKTMYFYYYSINNGLRGISGSQVTRIGVVTHELGHFMGLPDLNAGGATGGLGLWSLMATSWGWQTGRNTGNDQSRPTGLDGWSKYKLGYVTPMDITGRQGVYTLRNAQDYPDLHRINLNADGSEYLLIENRQPTGWDQDMPAGVDGAKGGLLILHIDNKALQTATNGNYYMDGGYPNNPSKPGWPQNNVHYPVALLAANGLYGSERVLTANSTDLWRSTNGGAVLSAYSVPNSNAYQGGLEIQTFVTIDQISASGPTMTYRYSIGKPQNGCANNDPCNGLNKGGVCVPGTGTSYTCRCNAGWSGANCRSLDVCAKEGTAKCGANALCSNDATVPEGFKCTCKPGTFGPNCMATVCAKDSGFIGCTQLDGFLNSKTPNATVTFWAPKGTTWFYFDPSTTYGFSVNIDYWGGSAGWVSFAANHAYYYVGSTIYSIRKYRLTIKSNGKEGSFRYKVTLGSDATAPACPSITDCTSTNSGGVCTLQGAINTCGTSCKPGYAGFLCEPTTTAPPVATCPTLTDPKYGATCAGTTVNSRCNVTCARNYIPAAGSTALCNADSNAPTKASWSNLPACTLATCDKLTGTKYSTTTNCSSPTINVTQSCTLACASGYIPTGTFTIKCSPDNTTTRGASWTNVPNCVKASCPAVKDAKYGTNTCNGTATGSSCTVPCATGYRLASGTNSAACTASSTAPTGGSWSSLPNCVASTCGLPTTSTQKQYNTSTCATNTRVNGTCSVRCASRYLGTATSVTCKVNATSSTGASWNGVLPTCKPITCAKLPTNMIISGSCLIPAAIGTQCTAKCSSTSSTFGKINCQLDVGGTTASWYPKTKPTGCA